jgi:hypothetical protein
MPLSGMSVRRAAWGAAGGGDVVTLSGGTVNAFAFGQNSIAFHYFNADGTSDRDGTTTPPRTQINASTDWVIPNGSAPGSYRVKYSNMTGDTGSYSGNISTVYAALTAPDKYVAVTDTTTGAGGKSITETVHIDDGTTEQDTGSYTQTADREDF